MFRRFTLWGTDLGFKVVRPPVFELWATPFFRTRDFGRKLENLYYIQFVQVGCHFLCLLAPEIDCNYLFKEITVGNGILEEKMAPRGFSGLVIPKNHYCVAC